MPNVTVVYDRPVDVLHVSLGELVAYEGDGLIDGIELDYALDGGLPCGAKVIGLHKNGWGDRIRDLADILAQHLGVDSSELALAIVHATRS